MQEFNTAKDAVLAVAPDTSIQMVRTDNYPVRITVEYGIDRDFTAGQEAPPNHAHWEQIFDARQQALFRKNSGQRTQSITAIKDAATKIMAANRSAD